MVFLIDAHNRSSHLEELAQMHRQRKTIFVDRAGWRIPVAGDMEADAYDREDTRYLIAKEDATDGPVLASARLLSTVRSHLMSDLFLHACDGRAPRGPSVWEVSRFCVSADVLGRRRRLALLWEMTCAVV